MLYGNRENFGGGPQPLDIDEYTTDVPLYNNSPTVVFGKIYDTPGNTPLNKANGKLRAYNGKYSRGFYGNQ